VIDNRRAQGDNSDRVIVVAHHSPSDQSVHPKYAGDNVMNGCYRSNLEEFIMDRPEITLFTHGHTHEDFDYHIGATRVVCNPRGYVGYEARVDSWKPKLIEL
jgi:Icc-related predicted phosphoesterase